MAKTGRTKQRFKSSYFSVCPEGGVHVWRIYNVPGDTRDDIVRSLSTFAPISSVEAGDHVTLSFSIIDIPKFIDEARSSLTLEEAAKVAAKSEGSFNLPIDYITQITGIKPVMEVDGYRNAVLYFDINALEDVEAERDKVRSPGGSRNSGYNVRKVETLEAFEPLFVNTEDKKSVVSFDMQTLSAA